MIYQKWGPCLIHCQWQWVSWTSCTIPSNFVRYVEMSDLRHTEGKPTFREIITAKLGSDPIIRSHGIRSPIPFAEHPIRSGDCYWLEDLKKIETPHPTPNTSSGVQKTAKCTNEKMKNKRTKLPYKTSRGLDRGPDSSHLIPYLSAASHRPYHVCMMIESALQMRLRLATRVHSAATLYENCHYILLTTPYHCPLLRTVICSVVLIFGEANLK